MFYLLRVSMLVIFLTVSNISFSLAQTTDDFGHSHFHSLEITGDLFDRNKKVLKDIKKLNVFRGETPKKKLSAYMLDSGKTQKTVSSLSQIKAYKDKSERLVTRFEQKIEGKKIYNAYAKAVYDKKGDLIHLIDYTVPVEKPVKKIELSQKVALDNAVKHNFGKEAVDALKKEEIKNSYFYTDPIVETVVVYKKNGDLEEAYLVENWEHKSGMLYYTLVDQDGKIISNELRTNNDTYNIFPIHPNVTAQAVVAGPGAGNAQSPTGWLAGNQTTTFIQGNNVSAYLDTNNDNNPDPGGLAVTNTNFTTAANLGVVPSNGANQAVAVQNLFYFNNLIHDTLYAAGFTEAAGNFQNNNFGNGGDDGDAVVAEAQDGRGLNNAFFATPNDGQSPRMMMLLWDRNSSTPNRDASLDSDVIWHEYGHGLTWRMVGRMSGAVAGALGEANGDVLAMIQNNDDAIGEYSSNDANGIRSSRYAAHTETIGDFDRSRSVHRNGEIYAAAIWNMWTLYQAAGLNAQTIMQDIVGGMGFTPSRPNYFEMRDGLLAAAPIERDCMIWQAFASKGMGMGGSMNQRGTNIVESTTTPDCSAGESCERDEQCGVDEFCQLVNPDNLNTCVAEGDSPLGDRCNRNRECNTGKCQGTGENRRCVCENDNDCGADQFCNNRLGINRCLADGSLQLGQLCLKNRECSTDKCQGTGLNRACVCDDDNDCGANQFCNNRAGMNRCLADGSSQIGDACNNNRECSTDKCQGTGNNRTCVCDNDNDCAANEYCNNRAGANRCLSDGGAGLGVSCNRNRECASGKCQGTGNNRQCVCHVDQDCPTNQECRRRASRNQCR